MFHLLVILDEDQTVTCKFLSQYFVLGPLKPTESTPSEHNTVLISPGSNFVQCSTFRIKEDGQGM